MKTRFLTAATFASVVALALVAQAFGPAVVIAAEHAECSHLVTLKLPDVKVTEAVAVPAAETGPIRAAHCRVNGVIEKDIRFSLLLPDDWNRKFMMGGGGGFVAGIDNQARASVNAGYATVGTDTGHQGAVAAAGWALNDLERQLNFGYIAVHRVAEVSKAILRSYYGSNETRSYFSGCSNGGRQALMEAQRYPDDFDGIVSGAPAYDFTGIGAQFIKDIQAAFPDPRNLSTPIFTNETLKSVEAQIVEKCDAVDGVKDGLMEDPRQCKIDVAALTGLTDAQRNVLKTIYGETKNKDGVIYPAQPFGGEGDAAGWPTWIVGVSPMMMAAQKAPSLRYAFGTEMFKNFVFSRSVLGLHPLRVLELQEGHGHGGDRPERDESEPRRVQGEEPQARHLARLVGPGAHGAREREISRPGRRPRSECARLHADVHDARRAALRRWSRTRRRRLGIGHRHLGRQGTGAGSGDRAEGCRGRRRVAVASALRLPAARDLQGIRKHR